jgi:phosphoadenosine phosphosulfate reductase
MSVSKAIQAISHPIGADLDPDTLNVHLAEATAEERVAWALKQFGKSIVLTSSFGAQAAVCLHLVASQRPDIPVILVDTGYLFPETYRYVDDLTALLSLNLNVYRAALTPAWQEARYGKLWEQGVEGLDRYNQMNKVEPMQRALKELGARAWITGLRRQQSASRQHLKVLGQQNGRIKVHPLVDWTDRDIYLYMTRHGLPYHPLWHKGYVSIGDVHTTRPLGEGMTEKDTRFFGLKRECGLHERA